MKRALGFVCIAVVVCGVIYGSYWIAKKTSYFFFYESFVQQTIREMVKPEYLK